MRALNHKLLREVWKSRGPLVSIAAVVAVAVMVVLTMRGTYESLVRAQSRYYHDARLPDVWAGLKRAPEALGRRIQALPGVGTVETRVTFTAPLDVPGLDQPGVGLFVSLPEGGGQPALSRLHLKTGRFPAPGRRAEIVVSDKFARANGFAPGDTLRALLNGRLRGLAIVGTAISPEHTYSVPPGALYPDDRRYGVVWMPRAALAPAYDMEGAFNEVALTLGRGARPARVRAALDGLLAPYGGLGAYGRADQLSHQVVQGELDQNRTMGTAIPAVFLLVAAFLLSIVLGRLVATQRTEIAVMKAFGYDNAAVGAHYLQFALVAVGVGALVGVVLGVWAGRAMVEIYRVYFDFPTLHYALRWPLVALSVGASALAAGVGALGAVQRAVALPPAEAMRPAPPATFRAGFFEKIGLGRVLPAAGRMVLRGIERSPLRSLFSSVGVAFSVAILIIGLFMFDGVDYMMDLQFRLAQRESLSVTFKSPLPPSVRYSLARLDGVTRVEAYRTVPVRLHAGHHTRAAAITGLAPGTRLRRIVTVGGGVQPVPPEGLVLSAFLAEKLGVRVGSAVRVEVLEGARRVAVVPVAGIVEDFIGVAAYMNLDALGRLARGGPLVTGAFLAVEGGRVAALGRQLKTLPAVAGVASPAQTLQQFRERMAQNLFVAVFFILGFSATISIAVVYNGARVALSERGRELASLRVLGFSRGEVAVLLLGEQALTTLAGIPLGWALGYALAAAVSAGLQSEAYRIPLVVRPSTFGWAALVTLGAALASGLLVRRRLDRMDLVEVLKTRE